MMNSIVTRFGIMVLTTFALGCASSPPAPTAVEPATVAAPAEAAEEGTSEVLAKKDPKAVRCPKKGKIVKGKCVLPVEETE